MNLVDKLRKLGLSEYEAKIYTGLVGIGEASAREIHETSGVPRTKVYDVLQKLSEKGFVEIKHGNPIYYRAVEPRKILEKQLADISSAAKECIYELEKMHVVKHKEAPVFWLVRGDWRIRTKIQELINEAKDEISILCTTPEVMQEISSMLEELKNKNIKILLLWGGGEIAKPRNVEFKTAEKSFFAEIIKNVEREYGILRCLMIFDGKRSLVIIEENGKKSAVVISLPIVACIQKNFFDWTWRNELELLI